MGSLFNIFHTASLAIRGDQTALNATAENISNQNTAGYARREVAWSGRDTVSFSNASASREPAVSVRAQRSVVLDAEVVRATSSASSASTSRAALDALQQVFAIDSAGNEASGISAALSGFFSAVQALSTDPTSSSAQQSMYSAAQAVVSSFTQTSASIARQSSQADVTVQDAVAEVNQSTNAIAGLNRQIVSASSGESRDALLDQRTAAVAQLSSFVGLQHTANSDGTISLYTSSGAPLVVGSSANRLDTTTVDGLLRLRVQGSDVTAGLTGGTIGGALQVRDGALQSTQLRLDALATGFANAVNAVNTGGRTPSGAAGAAVFALPAVGTHAAAGLALLLQNGSGIATAGSNEGSGGTSNAAAMLALQTRKNADGEMFAGVLSGLVNAVGMAASAGSVAASASASALTAATSAQEAVSGISLDTEAANLTQYQRAYQAEAKLLSIMNTLMATAINIGNNTAVS